MSSLWDKQVTKEWEPLHHVMQGYKGLAEGWQVILRLYENMRYNQKEIMKLDHNEIEKEASIVRLNTYRIAVESEQSFFRQEVVLDIYIFYPILSTKQDSGSQGSHGGLFSIFRFSLYTKNVALIPKGGQRPTKMLDFSF